MNESMAVMLMVVAAVVGGFAAVGAVLLIKIMRRRQATRGMLDAGLDTGVPARPMSQRHADRLMRRYVQAVVVALALLLVATTVVLFR